MRELVISCFLVHVDPRKPFHGERKRVGAGLHFVIHFHRTNPGDRLCERLEGCDQIAAATQLKILHGALAFVENEVADVIRQFRFVLLDVGERAVESLLFTGEKHEPDRAAGLLAAAPNGFRGAQHGCRAGAIVCGALGKIPGIKVRADDENLLRMLAPANFTDHVRCFDGSVRKSVLHVHANPRRDSTRQQALQLALVLGGHREDGDREIGVEAEDAGVREVQPRRARAALTADHREGSGLARRFQKVPEIRKDEHEVLLRLALHFDERDFTLQP